MTKRQKHLRFRWVWSLKASPEALWPYVANTNRLNFDSGLPHVTKEAKALPNARKLIRAQALGVVVEWEEEPFAWVWPHHYGVFRRYRRGPFREACARMEFNRRSDGGTDLVFDIDLVPVGWLGHLAAWVQVGFVSRRRLHDVMLRYDRAALSGARQPIKTAVTLSAGGRERLAELQGKLASLGADRQICALLCGLVTHADDFTVSELRPFVWADQWQRPRAQVLELFLTATRAGLLEMMWSILCPLCRGSQAEVEALPDQSEKVHCDTCQIDFEINFEQGVELLFRPARAIRAVPTQEFCMGSPERTPHIVAQALVSPLETAHLSPQLQAGRYRLRALGDPGFALIQAAADGPAHLHVGVGDPDWHSGEWSVSLGPEIVVANKFPDERLLILERTQWTDQAATARDAFKLQRFHDLFAKQALMPGRRVSIGAVVIVFTDLKGSTGLYRRVGDAEAFGRVVRHFDVLREAIAAEGGIFIKNIGDAVMAAFDQPAQAVRAMAQGQRQLQTLDADLVLKIGIHMGSCIACNLNQRVDYFGTTVNLAARLEGQSRGHDMVLSEAAFRDAEVQAWMRSQPGLLAEPLQLVLKGFDTPEPLWRLVWSSQAPRTI